MTGYAGQALLDALDAHGLEDWQGLPGGLRARFATGDFMSGLGLVQEIARLAEDANHHPDVTLTFPEVEIHLISHDVNAVTDRDLSLAGRISALAREQGIDADSRGLQVVDWGLDTADSSRIAPFWAALLTGDASNVSEKGVIDPSGQAPRVWFQSADPHEVPHQRFHPDVWVPAAEAADRIRAAVAAGGRIVDDSGQPRFTVLADADGNRACVCSLEGR